MSYQATVKFRGTDWNVTITLDGGYERDTNAHVIEWEFTDLTAEQHTALAVTDAEDEAIMEQLYRISYERQGEYDNFDLANPVPWEENQ